MLGPVMRGPSSSHTAGSYHLAKIARELYGHQPKTIRIAFDPNGSYARVFRQQASDRAFAAGFLGLPITDERFPDSLELAKEQGITIAFETKSIADVSHPNAVEFTLEDNTIAKGASVGGGMVELVAWNGFPISVTGKMFTLLAITAEKPTPARLKGVERLSLAVSPAVRSPDEKQWLVQIESAKSIPEKTTAKVAQILQARHICAAGPLYWPVVHPGDAGSAAELARLADEKQISFGEACLYYEAKQLNLTKSQVKREMAARWRIMENSVAAGFQAKSDWLEQLQPSAGEVLQAVRQQRVAVGGIHALASAYALAVLHAINGMQVICAAPTGGSAGVLPGVLTAWKENKQATPEELVRALFAAGGIGLAIATRATFAAEEAGCQVEIGAAGAMAAAAVVELAGGSPQQVLDAAAISLQNSMGSICDLVQGRCEIPCHTRNASAASSAFTCADLILGGYHNPIPLDETIDAMLAVGKMLPPELCCTSRGGLAVTPTAKKL